MTPPERSPERDAALEALLPNVPFDGWTIAALRRAAGPDADLLFPGGGRALVEAWCDLADRRMEAEAATLGLEGERLPARIRAIIALRLRQSRGNREAVRRALALLALPMNAAVAARCTARTVDTIWHAAGDRSADFSWYTKRATLAAIYVPTLLYWLRDTSEDDEATLAFLDRRLASLPRRRRRAAA
jgi:ubiquinone biosynthesis protein COQ9